jgi:glycosyltransferase involved in cell wall biosynthesis
MSESRDAGRGERSRPASDRDGTDRRRLAVVTQQYPPDKSGHASRLSDLAGELAARGWAVEVLAPPPCFPHGEFDRDWYRTRTETVDGVTVRRLWAWQPTESDPGTVSRLAYYVTFALHAVLWLALARRRHDALLTTTPPISTGLAGAVAVLTGRSWVVDVRDLWIDASVSLGFIAEGGLLERGSRRFQRWVLHAADAVTVTTETLGDHLREEYGEELAGKLVHVPTGVDVERFATADPEGADPLGSTDGPVVVYVGNIGHAQDLKSCVRALDRTEHDARLRLVGGGDAVEHLRDVAADAGIEDRVTFAGPVPHDAVPELLASAEVGLAPLVDDAELSYAMPTKVYEYMGAGLPVITTGNGELERFVEASGGGIHVENDPDAVADALDRLLGDEGRRRAVGAAGQAFVTPDYDQGNSVARLDAVLVGLVDGSVSGAETAADDGTGRALTNE